MPASRARPDSEPHSAGLQGGISPQPPQRESAQNRHSGLGAREAEIELALSAIHGARGGYVWTGEPGSGKSTLLDLIVAEASSTPAQTPLRVARVSGYPSDLWLSVPGGSAIETIAAQLFPELSHAVSTSRQSASHSDGTDAGPTQHTDAQRCAEVAALFTRELLSGSTRSTCVVVVDGFDAIDAFSRCVLTTLAAQRSAPVVLLASATNVDEATLPYPVALRRLGAHTMTELLGILGDEQPDPVAPQVAATLSRLLSGNVAAILQTARELSHDQLRGASMLPDPLPVVPVLHAIHGPAIAQLSGSERRLLLLASVAIVDRTEVLLSAADKEMAEVLDGPLAQYLHFVGGRFSFFDLRLRSLVHGEATLAERTEAHLAMARAHAEVHDGDAVIWHTALGCLAGDPALAPALLRIAEALRSQGELERAQRVAREALSQGASDVRARAQAIAGVAALGAGFVVDAVDSLRQAMRWGDDELRIEILAAYVEALCLYEGQVPDDAVTRHVNAIRAGTPDSSELTAVIEAICVAARLHAERGEGAATKHLLASALDLLVQLEMSIPAGERVVEGFICGPIGRSRTAISIAHACASVHGIDIEGGPYPAPRNFSISADQQGILATYRGLSLALAGYPDEAGRVLTDALAAVAQLDGPSSWPTASDVSASPLVEAHLTIAAALVDFWAGDLSRATEVIVDASERIPVTLPFAGVATALTSRLGVLGQRAAERTAAALSESGIAPPSRVVRFGLLVDRALSASFAGRRTEACALLELAAEQDSPSGARFLPLPGLGEVESWVDANQFDSAARALARLRSDVSMRSDAARRSALIRAEIALAELTSDDVYDDLVSRSRNVRSPYERARIELILGRSLARNGNTVGAHVHLVAAAELFERAGTPAWTRAAKGELSRLLEDVLEVTSPRTARTPAPPAPPSAPPSPPDGGPVEAATTPSGGLPESPLFSPGRPGENAAIAASLARWKRVLTEREFDVATLVAQGRSNREVAETLFLSIRTVEVHLGRVFRKLGVSSRLELAVVAHRK